jgi:hypothetical protein
MHIKLGMIRVYKKLLYPHIFLIYKNVFFSPFFQNRDDVKVLLLPVTSGANGLNLISASHVLLVIQIPT